MIIIERFKKVGGRDKKGGPEKWKQGTYVSNIGNLN